MSSDLLKCQFIDELSELMDRYIPALSPGDLMRILTSASVSCALNSRASLERESITSDVAQLAGAAYDAITAGQGGIDAKDLH